MNIDRVSQNLASGAYGARGKRTAEAGAGGNGVEGAGGSASRSPDGLSLSSEGKALSRAQSAVRAAPDVREQLVERLRQEVQSGRYVTKDAEIARLLAEGANG